jgi:hypothetical protein
MINPLKGYVLSWAIVFVIFLLAMWALWTAVKRFV